MSKARGHSKCKQQQQSGGDRNNSYNAQSHRGSQEEQVEGIQIKGASQDSNQSRHNGHGRGSGRNGCDFRSRSSKPSDCLAPPRRGDDPKHSKRRSGTPKVLADRMTRDNPQRQERARGSQTSTPATQTPAKRKWTPEDDYESHSHKKAHQQDNMHPAAPEIKAEHGVDSAAAKDDSEQAKKVVTMWELENMSAEERRKTRQQLFETTAEDPTKAAVAPKGTSKEIQQSGSNEKDSRKDNSTSKFKTPITNAPATDDSTTSTRMVEHVTPAKQYGARPKDAAIGTRTKPTTKTTATTEEAPKQSIGKTTTDILIKQEPCNITSTTSNSLSSCKFGTPPARRKRSSPEETNNRASKREKFGSGSTVASSARIANSEIQGEAENKPLTSQEIAERRSEKIREMMNDLPAYEDENIDKELEYVDYGVFSLPLLCSAFIAHQHPYEPVYKLPPELKKGITENAAKVFELTMIEHRQKALYLSRQKVLTSEDLGRNKVRKSKATRLIEDCDLYLYDGKIYIATERGLLLAADYLQFIGVPDEQPVRFQGHEPAWMAPVKAKREHRRVLVGYEATSEEKGYGNMDIFSGSTVVVYESGVEIVDGEENVMAYGARVADGFVGWFPYAHTCRMDWTADTPVVRDPNIIDWTTFSYDKLAVQGAARQAQENAQQQITKETRIRENEAWKAQQAAAAKEAVASQVAATLQKMSPIVLPPKQVPVLAAVVLIPSASPTIPASPIYQAAVGAAETTWTSGSEDSTLITATSQPDESQGETAQMLSVAGGSILRHDSPQARSNKAISKMSGNEVDKNDLCQDNTAAAEDGTVAGNGPVAAEVVLSDAFTKKRKSLPGFDEKAEEDAKKKRKAEREASNEERAEKRVQLKADREAKKNAKEALGRYDEVADWDTSDDDRAKDEEEEEEDEDEDEELSDDEEL